MVAGLRVLAAAGMAVLLGSTALAALSSGTRAGDSSALGDSPTPGDSNQPNIIVVLTDDMRADELRYLPAVRRLARSGVTFTRALSADSLCCPARATLLTGKLAHNHLTIGNYAKTHGGYVVFAEHNNLENLLPQWLDDRGYRTAWIGKYLNKIPAKDGFRQPDWSYLAVPVKRVYDYQGGTFSINGRMKEQHRYREVVTRRLLLSRVRDWSRDEKPFFVLYSALAPHNSRTPHGGVGLPGVQRLHRGFHRSRFVVRPSVHEKDLRDKPEWARHYVATHHQRGYPWGRETRRVEALLSVNDTVRRLIDTLKDEHELGRTVVMFASDNGFLLGEHGLSDKNKAYEESVHVPLVVRGPGFRGGSRVGQTVSLADVSATIRTIAGDTATHRADGVPLQDVRADPRSFDRRPIEIEGSTALYPEPMTLPTDSIGRFYSGAVWGPYTLVHYKTGAWEFYDRTVDPWQMHSSYTQHPHAGSPQALLRRWYLAHVDCRESQCNDLLPAR